MPLHLTSDGTVECIVGWSAGIHAGNVTEQAQASAVDCVGERRQLSCFAFVEHTLLKNNDILQSIHELECYARSTTELEN